MVSTKSRGAFWFCEEGSHVISRPTYPTSVVKWGDSWYICGFNELKITTWISHFGREHGWIHMVSERAPI